MPEYLAPAVYIEEIPSANKPIEGAGTSTAGMVGLTERGPVGQPTLVTSQGAYARLFGGTLDHRLLPAGLDQLPYAAAGFFVNGGARLYVTRIVGDAATFARATVWGGAPGTTTTPLLGVRANAGDTTLALDDAADATAGRTFVLSDGESSEVVTTTGAAATRTRLVLGGALRAAHAGGVNVVAQTVVVGAVIAAAAPMTAGGPLVVDDPTTLVAGDVLRISDAANPARTEFVTVAANGDADIVEGTLVFAHPAGSTVEVVTLADGAPTQALTAAAVPGASVLAIADASGFAADTVVTIDGERRVVTAVPFVVALAAPLAFAHAAGVAATPAAALVHVHARYRGAWGNALRVRTRDASLLATTVADAAAPGETMVRLTSVFGLFAGSVLDLGGGVRASVASVDRTASVVTLAAPLAAALAAGAGVRSVEFDLSIERIAGGKVAESELFERLALAAAHPRYAVRAVGGFDRATELATESGASLLVRLSDATLTDAGADVAGAAALRLEAPDAAVSWALAGGDDDTAGIDESSFIGVSAEDPGLRTGIQAMENEPAISMVAVPGQTSVAVQNALLNHCERMRYRFAVIETPVASTLGRARTHRQNFDTTRGAIYYPWLVIPDDYGDRGDLLPIAPSGHVLGIYARTDVARGVWKAPANEVVRGITGFETALTKGEQDILNPAHVNCFRDFRSVGRGLRLWGARTMSSDPEWKYINVRRLLLFIEQSLDTGLQWSVFEPNGEALWATVKQSIAGFLRGVWRDGGLEGVTEEEAFFVNIGYNVTMTQADIDTGRLIVEVGVAPVKPAEFVIVRISQKTREATA